MNVAWGTGNVVMALCHIGACAIIGDNNFLSAYCSIEHHNVLGSHCSFGPSVATSSRVHIGDRVRFGTGICIEPGVTIGADSVIASGLAIWQNIPERSLLKARLGVHRAPAPIGGADKTQTWWSAHVDVWSAHALVRSGTPSCHGACGQPG